jgi:hypothetical protein
VPLADTFVDAFSVDSNYGNRDYLEVSDYANGFSVIALMFDISKVSYNFNATSEIKLRLYCFNFTSPHIVGVHWCANNTWNEENLTFVSFGGFFRTSSESAVGVTSIDFWYEWKVTNIVRKAMEENYDNITLTLEVENTLGGTALSRFASKDQTTQEMREYSPQLVFTYLKPEADSRNIIIEVALGLTATVVITFLVYKFSKRHTRKKLKRAPKVWKNKRAHTIMHLLCECRNRQPLSRQLEPDLCKQMNVS